jgi:phosphatidylglycerophosphatase A
MATWFGSGLAPVAPGTAGTLAAIPLYLALYRLPLPSYLLTVTAFTFFACWIAGRAEVLYGAKDPGKIVIDEVAGFLVTMTAIPCSLWTIVAGFLLFRFFDIIKPFPARQIDQKLKNGYGVVLDDIVAGIYACAVLLAAERLM